MSTFVWFEYVSTEAPKAQGFFGELFGWSTKQVPMPGEPYAMIAQGDATIGGYRTPRQGAPQHARWLPHLRVTSAKDSAARAKALGGTIYMEATKIGEVGTMAVIADPHGGVIALWQPASTEEAPAARANGRFCWTELTARDAKAAVAFYSALGGLTDSPMDMGAMGTYHVLKSGEESVAGIMQAPAPQAPHAWTPYVQVANTDATIDRAKRLGASVVVPPTDIPNVGRFAIFADPQGAVLGVLQP